MMKFPFGILFAAMLFAFQAQGQVSSNAERRWLIDYYFMDNPKFQDQLVYVDHYILVGEYDKVKVIFKKLSKENLSTLEKSALRCYEATIKYNESEFEKSIELCNESLEIMRRAGIKNRYWIKAMNLKAKALGAINDYKTADKLLDSTILFAGEISDSYGLAAAYYYRGSFYSDKGNYKKCIEYMLKSSNIRKWIHDEVGLAACYAFLGMSYSYMDDYIQGIEYIQQSIRIRERLHDKRGLANSYLTLYKVYFEIGEMDKAMKSEYQSLTICRELKDLQCISGRYTNIGQIYQRKGDDQKALYYHFQALKLSQQLNIKNRIALVYENIARVYLHKKEYTNALKYLDSSSVLRKSFGDENGLASIDLVLATVFLEQNQSDLAIESALSALYAGRKLKLPHVIKEAHSILHDAFAGKKDVENAYYHFRKFVLLRDSIFNIDQSKELLRKELEFNFSKKQEMQRLEEVKKNEKDELERKKQETIILYSSSALTIVTLLLGFSFWQFRLKNRSKKQLEIANRDLNDINTQLKDKSEIIEFQNSTIQLKNNEITDSIRYAHQIQRAVLPSEAEFKKHFKEAFVFFEPKDIISGDFYWVTEIKEHIIYVTADCTGHGVPGGFMSMLGVSMLNELINENNIIEPAEILDKLREKVINALKQKGVSGEQQDGMDMTICVLNPKKDLLTFASANHSLYIVNEVNDEIILQEHNGDKFPVGIFGEELKPFHQQVIKLNKNDMIYTFSDGFADQFGGMNGKKFKYTQLKQLLKSVQNLSVDEQEKTIKDSFRKWKGEQEQIDDICLIGVRV